MLLSLSLQLQKKFIRELTQHTAAAIHFLFF